jgi:hypothetical protein
VRYEWLSWRFKPPITEYGYDGWTFHTHSGLKVSVMGPSIADPRGFTLSGGRKAYPTLPEAQAAALVKLARQLRAQQRAVTADLKHLAVVR